MKTRYQVVESKQDRAYLVIDTITGWVMLETENPQTANKKAQSLNDWENL